MLSAEYQPSVTGYDGGVYHTLHAWGVFPSSIARQARGCQYRTICLRKALSEMLPTPTVSAPMLVLLRRYRAWKIGPGVCDSVIVLYIPSVVYGRGTTPLELSEGQKCREKVTEYSIGHTKQAELQLCSQYRGRECVRTATGQDARYTRSIVVLVRLHALRREVADKTTLCRFVGYCRSH